MGKLFTCSFDKSLNVWDLAKGVKLSTNYFESEINCLTLSLDEYYIYLGCKNKIIYKF
jgi:WD40 repeat protein